MKPRHSPAPREVGHVVMRQAIRIACSPTHGSSSGRCEVPNPASEDPAGNRILEIGDIPPLGSIASKLNLPLSRFRHLFKSDVACRRSIGCGCCASFDPNMSSVSVTVGVKEPVGPCGGHHEYTAVQDVERQHRRPGLSSSHRIQVGSVGRSKHCSLLLSRLR